MSQVLEDDLYPEQEPIYGRRGDDQELQCTAETPERTAGGGVSPPGCCCPSSSLFHPLLNDSLIMEDRQIVYDNWMNFVLQEPRWTLNWLTGFIIL